MEIKPLSTTDFDTIFKAFSLAFADYELQLNRGQLQTMLKRRGFNPDLSFGAFEQNRIVAFTCNGIGNFNQIATAYDTGTGTLKEYRGKGLATKIFEESIPYLKKANIRQYLLEVLQHNTKAVSVYKKLGFEVSREFNYFIQANKEICNETKASGGLYSLKQIDIETFSSIPAFWDFHPSWQNGSESIRRTSADFISLGVFAENKLVGYCVFEPVSGDITQIAVDRLHRRKGVATLLFSEIIKLNKNDNIKILNTDIQASTITDFLKAKNIPVKGMQFEMIRKL